MQNANKDRTLLTNIINNLGKEEKTANEINEALNSNWTSVQSYLESMEKSGLVTKRQAGNRTYYKLKEGTKFRHDTYFGLPLDEKKAALLRNIYAYITHKWEKEKGRKPTQLELHKVSHDINKECKLGIPFGWYIYGAIATLATTGEIPTNYNLEQKVKDCADKIIPKYINNKYAYQTKMQQYRQEKKELYIKKEQIFAKLYQNKFNQDLYSDLDLLFLKALEITNNQQDLEIFNKYPVILEDTAKQRFLPQKDKEETYEVKEEIDNSFKHIWELIAMHNFKKDLEKYYDKAILEEHFSPHISEQRKMIKIMLDEMESKLEYEEPNGEIYLKLKTIREEIQKEIKENKNKQQDKSELTQEELFKAIGR